MSIVSGTEDKLEQLIRREEEKLALRELPGDRCVDDLQGGRLPMPRSMSSALRPPSDEMDTFECVVESAGPNNDLDGALADDTKEGGTERVDNLPGTFLEHKELEADTGGIGDGQNTGETGE